MNTQRGAIAGTGEAGIARYRPAWPTLVTPICVFAATSMLTRGWWTVIWLTPVICALIALVRLIRRTVGVPSILLIGTGALFIGTAPSSDLFLDRTVGGVPLILVGTYLAWRHLGRLRTDRGPTERLAP